MKAVAKSKPVSPSSADARSAAQTASFNAEAASLTPRTCMTPGGELSHANVAALHAESAASHPRAANLHADAAASHADAAARGAGVSFPHRGQEEPGESQPAAKRKRAAR